MREINLIIVHCSATYPWQDFGAAEIKKWHQQNGWRTIGYHYVVRLNGMVEKGRSDYKVGAHCKGYNAISIGVCYVGGLNELGYASDTRTEQQKQALRQLIDELKKKYPKARVVGHRELNPLRACPCFDVETQL